MILTKPMPATEWSLFPGVTSINSLDRLTDGKPARRCVFTSSSVSLGLIGSFSAPQFPTIIALFGLGDGFEGREIEISITAAGAPDPSVLASVTPRRLQDGSLAVIYQIPANLMPINGIDSVQFVCIGEVRYEIGQIHIAEAETWCITRDWTEGRVINSKLNTTPNGQPSRVARLSAREASVSLAPVSDTAAYGAGRSLQALQFSLDQYRPVLCIPAPRGIGRGETAPIDDDFLYNTALFGYCTNLGRLQVVQNSNLVQLSGLTFREAPARAG